jgi:hypothetical protein
MININFEILAVTRLSYWSGLLNDFYIGHLGLMAINPAKLKGKQSNK